MERKMKKDDKMKIFLNKIKAIKRIDKNQQIAIQLLKINYIDNPKLLESIFKEI